LKCKLKIGRNRNCLFSGRLFKEVLNMAPVCGHRSFGRTAGAASPAAAGSERPLLMESSGFLPRGLAPDFKIFRRARARSSAGNYRGHGRSRSGGSALYLAVRKDWCFSLAAASPRYLDRRNRGPQTRSTRWPTLLKRPSSEKVFLPKDDPLKPI